MDKGSVVIRAILKGELPAFSWISRIQFVSSIS